MRFEISDKVEKKFPDLKVLSKRIKNVKVERKSKELQEFKRKIIDEARNSYDLKKLKGYPTFRAYRDFFWEIDIDPTKTRPASEALLRRVLQGKELPTINTLVDAYNLASLKSEIPLAAFDRKALTGNLGMRFAREGESFQGIGMDEPLELNGGEIVVSDSEKLIAVYPYRDSNDTKITTNTEDVLLMVCGVPGVADKLPEAEKITIDYVTRFCGGEPEELE